MTDPELEQRVARLQQCAESMACNAANLRLDTMDNDPNADFYIKTADEHEQWASDLRAILAALRDREAECEQLRLAMLGGEDAPGYAASLPIAEVLRSFKMLDAERLGRAELAEAKLSAMVEAATEVLSFVMVRKNAGDTPFGRAWDALAAHSAAGKGA